MPARSNKKLSAALLLCGSIDGTHASVPSGHSIKPMKPGTRRAGLGTPEEVAALALFLASNESIRIDRGSVRRQTGLRGRPRRGCDLP
jgi:hypothetical protein